jgi:threonine dehydrogenase-like Zn-dependent dehydrogenase
MGGEPVQLGDSTRDAVREATGGRGPDAVLEAVGTEVATRLAFNLVRPGGTIGAVGVHHEAVFPFSPGQAYDKNLTVSIGRCPARHYMERLIPVARKRSAELRALFTHHIPLDDAPEAYRTFDAKALGCVKVGLLTN